MMNQLKPTNELLRQAQRDRNVKFLCWYFFKTRPTKTQLKIIKAITFKESKRIVISCYTRYGKSWSVSQGVLLYIWLNSNKRINLIAPQMEQTAILRNYIAGFMLESKELVDLLDLDLTGIERIKREVSRSRITFRNGCELKILSAEGKATRLMGWGGDLIILDESCLIDYEVYRQKISRMLGDDPESMLVEIGNPWHRDNQMFQHWISPEFMKIHIGWKEGLEEGRISEKFLKDQQDTLTSIEFTILYEAMFPEESEDSLFKYRQVLKAQEKKEPEGKKRRKILGVDVARFGKDLTVFTVCEITDDETHDIIHIEHIEKSDLMVTAGRIVDLDKKFGFDKINIDVIGMGGGVVDRLRELDIKDKIVEAHFGQSCIDEEDKERYLNKKAEKYFHLRNLFENGEIRIPKDKRLINELMSIKFEFSSSGKIKISELEKSPDFADSLVFSVWGVEKEFYGGVMDI